MLRLLNDDSAGIREFSEVISTDASFAWEVLRAANSPLFSLPYEIDDLFQAVSVIGVERVRGMVFVAALSSGFRHAMREQSLLACWKHSLATAYLAAEMAPGFRVDSGKAYTAGLLHDLGRLALMTAFPAKYAGLIEQSHRDEIEMCVLEEQFFEINHCVAGASIAAAWSLPVSLAEVCLKHHDDPLDSPSALLLTVIAANRMAHLLGFQPVYEFRNTEAPTELPNGVSDHITESTELLHQKIEAYCTGL
jgi:putative nucleotidyltransferase with HDIG domain